MGLKTVIFWKTIWQDLPEAEHKHIHSRRYSTPGYMLCRNACTGIPGDMNMKVPITVTQHSSIKENGQMFNSRMSE